MSLSILEVFSNVECDTTPTMYQCDTSFYDDKVTQVLPMMKESGANYMVFWWTNEHDDAMFLKESESDSDEIVVTVDDVPYTEFDCDDEGLHLSGTTLKIYADGAVQIVWELKHSCEEMWVDLK